MCVELRRGERGDLLDCLSPGLVVLPPGARGKSSEDEAQNAKADTLH